MSDYDSWDPKTAHLICDMPPVVDESKPFSARLIDGKRHCQTRKQQRSCQYCRKMLGRIDTFSSNMSLEAFTLLKSLLNHITDGIIRNCIIDRINSLVKELTKFCKEYPQSKLNHNTQIKRHFIPLKNYSIGVHDSDLSLPLPLVNCLRESSRNYLLYIRNSFVNAKNEWLSSPPNFQSQRHLKVIEILTNFMKTLESELLSCRKRGEFPYHPINFSLSPNPLDHTDRVTEKELVEIIKYLPADCNKILIVDKPKEEQQPKVQDNLLDSNIIVSMQNIKKISYEIVKECLPNCKLPPEGIVLQSEIADYSSKTPLRNETLIDSKKRIIKHVIWAIITKFIALTSKSPPIISQSIDNELHKREDLIDSWDFSEILVLPSINKKFISSNEDPIIIKTIVEPRDVSSTKIVKSTLPSEVDNPSLPFFPFLPPVLPPHPPDLIYERRSRSSSPSLSELFVESKKSLRKRNRSRSHSRESHDRSRKSRGRNRKSHSRSTRSHSSDRKSHSRSRRSRDSHRKSRDSHRKSQSRSRRSHSRDKRSYSRDRTHRHRHERSDRTHSRKSEHSRSRSREKSPKRSCRSIDREIQESLLREKERAQELDRLIEIRKQNDLKQKMLASSQDIDFNTIENPEMYNPFRDEGHSLDTEFWKKDNYSDEVALESVSSTYQNQYHESVEYPDDHSLVTDELFYESNVNNDDFIEHQNIPHTGSSSPTMSNHRHSTNYYFY